MPTKDSCSSFNDKTGVAVYGTSNDQYNNFNLNQNHQYLNVTSKISKSVSIENKKVQNYAKQKNCNCNLSVLGTKFKRIAALTKPLDLTDKNYSHAKKDCGNLKKDLSFNWFLNVGNDSENKEFKERNDADAKSNSTLSLIISAYDNSVEGGFTDSIGDKNGGFIKNKQLFPSEFSMIQNPFEFPRQQEGDQKVEQEVMGFKASQRLINPNQPAATNITPLENGIAELSLVPVSNVAVSVESQQQPLINTKPQLNRDILREVFSQLLKARYLRDEIDKFMMCGREPFQLALDIIGRGVAPVFYSGRIYAQLPNIECQPARIDIYNESDDSDYDGEPIVGTGFSMPLFVKPISLALASTMTSLDLRGFSPLLIPMLKSLDREMVEVKIFDEHGQLKDILDASVNITNVREGVTIGLSDEDYNFASAMKSFAIPCHKLTIKKTQMNKMFTGINLNNPYLRNIRDLKIQGRFRMTPSFQKQIKEFATFLSLNFPNLENLNIDFLLKNGYRNYYWNWNDTRIANYFKVLRYDIKGCICFKILNKELEDINLTKYHDVQENDIEHYKIFPINGNLTFKMAYRCVEESEYYGSEYGFAFSGYSS